MDKDKLIERLLATFMDELEQGVRDMNRDLMALEKEKVPETRQEILKTLFRTAHSLKGASRSVDLLVIEEACHRMEEILSDIRDGRQVYSPEFFQVFFEAADALGNAAALLREKKTLSGSALEALIPLITVKGSETILARPTVEITPAKSPLAAAEGSFVKISTEKLDRLTAECGELLTMRRRAESRNSDLAALSESLGRWKQEWKWTDRFLRKLHSPKEEETAFQGDLPKRAAQTLRQVKDRLAEMEGGLERLAKGMERDKRALDQTSGFLSEGIRSARMLPFSEACEGLERTVRDMAAFHGKEAVLILRGGEVELDRTVLEKLRDPLFHLIRNAVDHGLESPEERKKAGKPTQGRVVVEAALKENRIEITVKDDGRGLNLSAIREKAKLKGWNSFQNDQELSRLIFAPGFSTSKTVSSFSGRGVGLDVVKSQVESVHGSVDFTFEPGQGTCFTLIAPLTLTTVRALLVFCGDQTYAFLSSAVERLIRVSMKDLHLIEGKESILLEGRAVPLMALSELLGSKTPLTARGKAPGVILSLNGQKIVVVVDEVSAEQEIVAKAMGPCLPRLRYFSGATVLSTGKIALILNARNLLKTALEKNNSQAIAQSFAGPALRVRRRLLIVDDSVTIRTLEKSILESEGYEVAAAPDGVEAWRMLQAKGADLVVSDVEMPRMDGFTLTEAIRGSARFKKTPVVLVTALENDSDRVRGMEAGADAYLLKSAFDQKNLLAVISRLLLGDS